MHELIRVYLHLLSETRWSEFHPCAELSAAQAAGHSVAFANRFSLVSALYPALFSSIHPRVEPVDTLGQLVPISYMVNDCNNSTFLYLLRKQSCSMIHKNYDSIKCLQKGSIETVGQDGITDKNITHQILCDDWAGPMKNTYTLYPL
jgi:hypothetical protein